MTNDSTIIAGIDTGKAKLDIALRPGGETLQVDNTRAGHRDLLAFLTQHQVSTVGIEASGGYERAVLAVLCAAGVRVVLLQPRQVRAFAQYKLRRAKNDRLDAGLIAECVAGLTVRQTGFDPRLAQMGEALRRIEQIEADIVRAKTRRESFHDARLRKAQTREVERLQRLQKAELKRLVAEVDAVPALAARLSLIESVEGIGRRTALTLLIDMPELGQLSREQAACLAGLAPFDHDSGTHKGVRRIGGGRASVRRALYAAALPASFRWNAALCQLYQRLITAGKPHKKALTACARKRLTYANAVLQRGTPWTTTEPLLNGC